MHTSIAAMNYAISYSFNVASVPRNLGSAVRMNAETLPTCQRKNVERDVRALNSPIKTSIKEEALG
jgi:hypothetical protein